MASYYANRNTGSNANPGTILSPKRDIEDPSGLGSLGPVPGDFLYGARDSVWPQQRLQALNNGTASQRITWDEYGAGAQRPTMDWELNEPGAYGAVTGYQGYTTFRNWRIVNVGPAQGAHTGIGSHAFAAENSTANSWYNCEVDHVSEQGFFCQRISAGDCVIDGCLVRRSGLRWISTSGDFGAAISVVRAPHPSGSTGTAVVRDCVVDRVAGEAFSIHETRNCTVQGGIAFAAISAGYYMTVIRDCSVERPLCYGTTDTTWHRDIWATGWVGYGCGNDVEPWTSASMAALHGNSSWRLGLVAFCQNGMLVASGHASTPDYQLVVEQMTFVDNYYNWEIGGQEANLLAGSNWRNNAAFCYTLAASNQTGLVYGGSVPSGAVPDYSMWVGNTGGIAAGMIGGNDTSTDFALARTTNWQSINAIDYLGDDVDPLSPSTLGVDIAEDNFFPSELVTTIQALGSPALDFLGRSGLANPGAIAYAGDEPPVETDQHIRVERHVVNFGASSDTASLTFTQAGKNAASVWPHLCNVRKASGGPASGTSSQESLATLGVTLSSITASGLTLTRDAAGTDLDVRVYVEVWFYDGPSGGDNEFIVRWSGTVAVTDTNDDATQAISGVSSAGDLVAESLGVRSDAPGGYAHFCRLHLGGTSTLTVERENSGGDIVAAAIVVEMTGANWQVEEVTHTFGAWNTTETETISTITDWATAFTVSSMEVFDDESQELGCLVWPGASATQVRFRVNSDAAGSLGVVTAFVVRNADMPVDHYDTVTGGGTAVAAGANPGSASIALTAVPDLDYAGAIFHATLNVSTYDASPAGFANYRLTAVDALEVWQSRSADGPLQWAAQVIDFSEMVEAGGGGGSSTGAPSGLTLLGCGG